MDEVFDIIPFERLAQNLEDFPLARLEQLTRLTRTAIALTREAYP